MTRTADGYELHDLSSANGTFINGHSVDGVWLLQSECIIELGDSITLEYRLGDPPEDSNIDNIAALEMPTPVTSQSYLVVTVSSHDEPTVYALRGAATSVGRSTENDIVIVEPELSRRHFLLTLTLDGYVIEDLGSTNGTIVNGEPLEDPRLLYVDDVIQVGTTVHLLLTNTPEKYVAMPKTDRLLQHTDASDTIHKRKTSQAEIAGIIKGARTTSEIGTGVDHVTLENQVLITYAHEDWETVVAPLVDYLYQAEIETWVRFLFQYLAEGSKDWLAATEQARLECWLLVVVVSKNAMESDVVRKNWRHFQNREKPIILLNPRISRAITYWC